MNTQALTTDIASAIRPRSAERSSSSGTRLRPLCHHCGLPVDEPGRWTVELAGSIHETCCAGCQAVAAAIADSGLDDYYRARDLPAAPATRPASDGDATLYDAPEIQARFVRSEAGVCETTLLVDGLRCGACSWLLEQALQRTPGIIEGSVNLGAERANLRWDPSQTRLSTLIEAAGRFGFTLRPFDAASREAQLRSASRARLRRLFVAGIGMMQVMMYAFPAYIAGEGEIEPAYLALMRWASLALTVPVVFYSAWPFFSGAAREWQRRAPGMDTPVAIGIAAAFLASVWATISGTGEVWFDTVTMFVFLLLAARHLEWLARLRATRAIDALAAAAPQSVLRLADQQQPERIPAMRLTPGERFMVGTGEPVAVDAALDSPLGRFDLSLLTGESRPVERTAGETVPGGALNLGAPVILRSLASQADSTLSTIARLAARAAGNRPPVLALTERIARWFTAGLLALAVLTWFAWLQIDPSHASTIAIAVLVVSCPCALSLATPAALAAAQASALRRGMITTRGDVLESIADATDVVLDKTGTLTYGRPVLTAIEPTAELDAQRCLAIAAALETSSSHPLARAITEAARERDLALPAAEAFETRAGEGVEARIDGRLWRLGSAHYALGAAPPDLTDDTRELVSEVWLGANGRAYARLQLADTLRDETPSVIASLRAAGLTLHLVSGDRAASVEPLAKALGIDSHQSQASPDDKLNRVRALQAQGRRVLAIGDGINDAPLLAAADASIAVGEASTLARTSAGVVLLGGRLDDVIALRTLALRARRVIAQNLGWALAYNLVAIPAAAFGLIAPWVAALGMSASSLLVAGNALRLLERRERVSTPTETAPPATVRIPTEAPVPAPAAGAH